MAEHISGSETEFVAQMNERATGLSMTNTHFVNCCGLDTEGHITTARDISIMSRELITKYPAIYNYTSIWMQNITHVTKKGSSEFGLTNTNKLIKQYEYATGLKTGSTSLAKYCVSATANRNNIDLIAVIMAADDYKVRFSDATTLLNYGFSKCQVYADENSDVLSPVNISGSISDLVEIHYSGKFTYLDTEGSDFSSITKEIKLNEDVSAPVTENDIAGKAVYSLNGKEIGSVDILFSNTIEKATYKDFLIKSLSYLML